MNLTAPTLAQVRRPADQLAAAADEPGAAMTAAPGARCAGTQDQI